MAPVTILALGVALVGISVVVPPAGALAGVALVAWGSTQHLVHSRPTLAAINWLVYAVLFAVMLGATADLLYRRETDVWQAVWLVELAAGGWLMLGSARAAVRGV